MIEVYQIPLQMEKLRAMPDSERALFVLLGYAANQLNFFSKLVIFSTNQDGHGEPEQTLSGAQSQMALRVVIGVLNEAWRLIHTRFLGGPYAKEYTPLLDQAGAEAFARLKKELDASDGLFSKLRSGWIFHHPDTADLTAAFEDATAHPEWSQFAHWFFSHSNYNSFYLLSEFVTLQGILRIVGETDLIEGQKILTIKITAISEDMSHLIQAIIAVLWRKHFGNALDAEKKLVIETAPDFFTPWIPFFVNIPDQPPPGTT